MDSGSADQTVITGSPPLGYAKLAATYGITIVTG
jgi:hypothetical protein